MIKFNRQFDPREVKLLIFDLDGTLIDSRLDLIHSVNAMLRHFKRSELPGEVIASYVGDGAPMLVRRALGDPKDEHFAKSALEFFLTYYRAHKLDNTHVYAGIEDSLAAISNSNGIRRKMAVLSNKPVNPSRAIVEAPKKLSWSAILPSMSSPAAMPGSGPAVSPTASPPTRSAKLRRMWWWISRKTLQNSLDDQIPFVILRVLRS